MKPGERGPGVPRRALSMLQRILPADVRADALADLEELYHRRAAREGAGPARQWYRAQVLSYAMRFGAERMRGIFRRGAGRAPRGVIRSGGSPLSASSWLDWKLGARMMVKYPGLTIIGGLSLATAIAIGALAMEVAGELLYKRLPFDEGERVVRIETIDAAASAVEPRVLHDFAMWRESLNTITELGAARLGERSVVTGEGRVESMRAAEITASAFPLTRVAPMLGRPLYESDELPGADPVVVLGHDVWQTYFLADPAIIGRVVTVGRVPRTVVGVMPPRFGFPYNQQLWMPLTAQDAPPRGGPPVQVFARLAEGVSWESGVAELGVVTARLAKDHPATHAQLRASMRSFAGRTPGHPIEREELLIHLVILLVLGAVCANVATLIFARTAMRESEIIVRSALGASRARIITQLVIESLVLALAAAVFGLVAAQAVMRYAGTRITLGFEDGLPFWVDLALEPTTVAYALMLAVTAAALIGLLPALKATGAVVHQGLKSIGTAGTAMKFGGIWSFIIGGQVAITLLCLPAAAGLALEYSGDQATRAEFPVENYLTFRLSMDGEALHGEQRLPDEADIGVRRALAYEELARQLHDEPGVTDVTFGDRLPGMQPDLVSVEVEHEAAPPVRLHGRIDGMIAAAAVGTGYHEAFGADIVAGRALHSGDAAVPDGPVVVNEAFMRRLGRNPVGARLRTLPRRAGAYPGPWREVVGVIADVGLEPTGTGEAEYMYRAASLEVLNPVIVAVRGAGDAAALAPRVSTLAHQIDPGLQIRDVVPLQEIVRRRQMPMMVGSVALAIILLIALVFSAAGLYALMAVAVERRTREIGIRVALGADPLRVLRSVFARAGRQIGGGIIAGNAIILLMLWRFDRGISADVLIALLGVSAIMAAVGVLACAAPARRALRVQPTEALRFG